MTSGRFAPTDRVLVTLGCGNLPRGAMVVRVGAVSTSHISRKGELDWLDWIGLQNDCPRDSPFILEKGPVRMWTNKRVNHKPKHYRDLQRQPHVQRLSILFRETSRQVAGRTTGQGRSCRPPEKQATQPEAPTQSTGHPHRGCFG
jgi:hypothetical protein